MLDPRVRVALVEFSQGHRALEETAQLLAQVHRETGCLAIYPSSGSGLEQQSLIARFREIVDGEKRS